MLPIVWIIFYIVGVFGDEWDYLCVGVPDSVIAHPYDCKKFFQCDNEEAIPGTCPAGFAFDITFEDCLPEAIVDCSHISTTIQTTESSTESSTAESTTVSMSSTTESSGGDWDYLCEDVEPFTTVHHPNNCAKYFQCLETETGMTASPKECQEDYAYDKERGICVPEEFVDCSHIITTTENPSSTTTPTETSPETTTPTETSPETTTEETSTTESSTTETSSSTETTSTTETTTPEESSTEPTTTTEEITTTPEVTTTPEITSTTTIESSTSTTSSPTSTVSYPPGMPITPGPEIPEPGVQCPPLSKAQEKPIFLASKIDCSKYYLCYLGLPVAFTCQEGTHFNQFEENCDDPFYAHCQVSTWTDPNPYPECPRRGKVSLPRVGNCEYFVFCNEGVGSLQKCPFYYGWDVVSQRCLLRTEATCL